MMPLAKLKQAVERDAERLHKAQREKPGLFGLMLYGGVLGLLFVLPIVGGAYLGRWLDALSAGYSVRWTMSFIVLGIVLGGWNVYWYLRDR